MRLASVIKLSESPYPGLARCWCFQRNGQKHEKNRDASLFAWVLLLLWVLGV